MSPADAPDQRSRAESRPPNSAVGLRLLAAVLALGAGVAALVVAIMLIRSALG